MIKTFFLSCLLAVSAQAQCPWILTEIQADPTPSRGLPEVEYLEFYLDSSIPVNLSGWNLHVNSTRIPFPNQTIPPFSYFVVVAESQRQKVTWDALTVWVSRLTLPNSGAELSLTSPQGRCFSLSYLPQWGKRSSEGGYSLEVQNKSGACLGGQVWSSTQSLTGGTPGKPPVQGYQALPQPKVTQVWADSTTWTLRFSQSMRPSVGHWQGKALQCRWVDEKTCQVDQALPKSSWQSGILADFEDCTGQLLADTLLTFGRFDPPSQGEWRWNELLVDPLDGTSGFVELKSHALEPRVWTGGSIEYQSSTSTRKVIFEVGSIGKILSPGDVWALTKANPGWEGRYQVGKSIDFLNSWHDLSNEGGTLQIKRSDGQLLDQITYSSQWHHPMLRAEDGRSWQKMTTVWNPTPTLWGLATPGWEPQPNDIRTQWEFEPAFLSKSKNEAILHFSLPDDQFILQAKIYDRFGQMRYQYPSSHIFPKSGHWIWSFPDLPGSKEHYFVFFQGFHPDGRLFHEWVPFIWEIN